MKDNDDLGMKQKINRRQFINGVACALGATALSQTLPSWANTTARASIYPPELKGLRGSHPGSFEVAHSVARHGQHWPMPKTSSGQYDLVVVGAGASGLAAARFYQQQHPDAKILILDNHDDFGGHAKRNEFTVNGKTLIGYGGSQTMENPNSFPAETKALLDDLGIDLKRFDTAFDQQFYQRHNMKAGMFFKQIADATNLHVDFTVGNISGDELIKPSKKQIDQLPLPQSDKDKLYELMVTPKDYFAGIDKDKQIELIWTLSYKDYLQKYCGVSDALLAVFKQVTDGTYGESFDLVSAGSAWGYAGHPGFDGLSIDYKEEIEYVPSEPYIHHFPDGNASIARLLVRKLIPNVAPGNTMEDIVTAKFDYQQLDKTSNNVQLRLSSTVINVVSGNNNGTDKNPAKITYVNKGKTTTIDARHCVLACYNGIIPYIMPELKKEQTDALKFGVKTPLVYVNVALTNWRAFHKAGINESYCPDSFYSNVALDFPVSFNDYQFSASPDEPIIAHMEYCPTNYGSDLDMKGRYRLGRHQLLAMSFEDFEREIREQLTDMLGDYGFDAANDIAGITVNRWPHGYSYWDDSQYHLTARKKVGNVAIANSDSGAMAMLQAAIQQGHRAVHELI